MKVRWRQRIRQFGDLLLLVGLGLMSSTFVDPDRAQAFDPTTALTPFETSATLAQLVTLPANAPGVHFYGEVPESGQIGAEYMVYRIEGDRVYGAFFLVQSEYACFDGVVTQRGLEIAITDPYGEFPPAPYMVAFRHETVEVAGQLQQRLTLENLDAIATVGELEQSLLNTCQP
jgi:hypothetical protein